jgi:hypothetical protein
MPSKPKDQEALRAFADELKAWRTQAGWTQGQLAIESSYSEQMITFVETCRKPATMQMGLVLDRVFQTPGFTEGTPDTPGTPGTFGRLAARIRKLSFPVNFRPFTDAEEEATSLYIFEHALLPGLFQTDEYARTLIETYPGTTPEQAAGRLTVRKSRQDLLARTNPPRLWVLLYEPVLHTLVGSPEIMYRQLTHMVEAARKPNVTFQILPSGLHVAVKGAFHIAEVDGVCSAAYTEDATDGRTTQNPETDRENQQSDTGMVLGPVAVMAPGLVRGVVGSRRLG